MVKVITKLKPIQQSTEVTLFYEMLYLGGGEILEKSWYVSMVFYILNVSFLMQTFKWLQCMDACLSLWNKDMSLLGHGLLLRLAWAKVNHSLGKSLAFRFGSGASQQ